jgi:hypothetical protein
MKGSTMKLNLKLHAVAAFTALSFLLIASTHAQQSRNRNHLDPSSTYINTKGPVTQCSDLDVRFHGVRGSRSEETLTVPRVSAPILRAHVGGAFGIAVSAASGPDYSIVVCKYAALELNSSSGNLLNSIRVTVQSGEISATAPDEQNWMIYLIIQAPVGAPLDVSTTNGPLDLHEISGEITARVQNGPLAINHCTGDIDAASANGPISVKGSTGIVHVRTDNGPLSVELDGDHWESGEVTARTQNGPLNLSLSENYRSGVAIETDGYSPVHCTAACNVEHGTWNDRTRSIQIGPQPAIVKLFTQNGPVNIDTK